MHNGMKRKRREHPDPHSEYAISGAGVGVKDDVAVRRANTDGGAIRRLSSDGEAVRRMHTDDIESRRSEEKMDPKRAIASPYIPRAPTKPASPMSNPISPLWSARSCYSHATPSPPSRAVGRQAEPTSPGKNGAHMPYSGDSGVRAVRHVVKASQPYHLAQLDDRCTSQEEKLCDTASPRAHHLHEEMKMSASASSSASSPISSRGMLTEQVVGKTRRGEAVPSQNATVHISRKLPPRSSLSKVLPRLVSPRASCDAEVLESPVLPKSKPSQIEDTRKPKRPDERAREPARQTAVAKRRPLLRSEIEKHAPYRHVNGAYRAAVVGGSEIRKTHGSDPRWDRENPACRSVGVRPPNVTGSSPRKREIQKAAPSHLQLSETYDEEQAPETIAASATSNEEWRHTSPIHPIDIDGKAMQVSITATATGQPLQSPLHDAPVPSKCSSSRDHSESECSDGSDNCDDDRVYELPSRPSLPTESGFRSRSESVQSCSTFPRRDSIIGIPAHLLQQRERRPSLMLEPMNQRKYSYSGYSSNASSRRSSVAKFTHSATSSRRSSLAPRSPRQSISEMQLSPRAQALCLQNDMKAGKTIGMGQFGRVFMAQENDSGRLIAVKEIMLPKPPESNDEESIRKDDNELAALETELILLQTLKHPNVVHYIGHELSPSISEPERLFIFLEYLAGGSLKSQLHDFGPFSDTLIQKYGRQLVNGVYFLHTYSPAIVHRDLKNANLLLTSDGQIKISDFGCAKLMFEETIKSEPGGHTITGTVPYMAPEVLKGKSLGCSQDIWSLGCCILEMCTANHPWKGFQLDNILHAYKLIAESDMIPPLPTQRPKSLREFISCCLVRDAKERPEAGYLLNHHFVCTPLYIS